jgi:hypothetical protein
VFAEDHARWLLLLHTVLAVGAVAATTHLAVWLWRVRRGAHGRLRAARKFALTGAILHVGAFVAGNLMYPVYKVDVKVGYLQNPPAVLEEGAARATRAAETRRRYLDPTTPAPGEAQLARATEPLPHATEKVSRWFDSKEHWVAMSLPIALALAFLLPVWRPEPGAGGEITTFVFVLAVAWSASLWLGAIVGVVTATWRAVG